MTGGAGPGCQVARAEEWLGWWGKDTQAREGWSCVFLGVGVWASGVCRGSRRGPCNHVAYGRSCLEGGRSAHVSGLLSPEVRGLRSSLQHATHCWGLSFLICKMEQ